MSSYPNALIFVFIATTFQLALCWNGTVSELTIGLTMNFWLFRSSVDGKPECAPKPFVSSTIPTTLNLSYPFPIIVYLDIFPSFTDTFTGIAFMSSGVLFLFLWGVSEPSETWLIHTVSKLHCLIHELYPTNHHLFLEHAIYETSCLLLPFPNRTICHLSILRSISLIWHLSPLSLALSSFFLCWG